MKKKGLQGLVDFGRSLHSHIKKKVHVLNVRDSKMETTDLYLEIGSSDDKNKFTFCRSIAKISAHAEKVQEDLERLP